MSAYPKNRTNKFIVLWYGKFTCADNQALVQRKQIEENSITTNFRKFTKTIKKSKKVAQNNE